MAGAIGLATATAAAGTAFSGEKAAALSRRSFIRLPACRAVRCEAAGVVASSSSAESSIVAPLEQPRIMDRYMMNRSCIAVIGLSVHTAPVEIREKLALPEAQWPRAIEELSSLNHIAEAAVLSTCNRMEIYVVAYSWHPGVTEVFNWIAKASGIPVPALREHMFVLRDGEATQHLFEVAAGLDSLVLGEGQILAQVKQAVKVGQESTGWGTNVDRMFKAAITAGKRVRTETSIASGAVSISSAAVDLAMMKLPQSKRLSARMLVVGAGKMAKLVIKHLAAKGCRRVVVVNRTSDNVNAIRKEVKGLEIVYRPLPDLLDAAAESDIVFTATASETPLFLKEHVEALPHIANSLGGVRLFIDISMPRNVVPCVSGLAGARIYNVDDLREAVEVNRERRLAEAAAAEAIIREEAAGFAAWRNSRQVVPTIKELRDYMDRIRVSEMEKCLGKFSKGELTKEMKKAIEELSVGITNRVLQRPLQHLRCGDSGSSSEEAIENMLALNRIFGLGTERAAVGAEAKIKGKVGKKGGN